MRQRGPITDDKHEVRELPYINLANGATAREHSNREKPLSGGGSATQNGRHRITFLLRKNPESIGGVQRYLARLTANLDDLYNIEKLIWTGADWAGPLYFPYFYNRSIRNGAGLVFCDDAVTSLLGARIREKSHKKVVAAVHGLDVILPIEWYQRQLKSAFRRLDKLVCVSQATAQQVKLRGASDEVVTVIPCPAEENFVKLEKNEELFRKIEAEIGVNLRGKKVLLSLGRPIKRKGFDYFADRVFPHLSEDCVYIVAGPVLKKPAWIELLSPLLGKKLHHNLLLASGAYTSHERLLELCRHPRVYYINEISNIHRNLLYSACDLFVMPNRTVEGDMEGFGQVALEACMRGVPVIATGIEGIVDAVIDGENGLCFREGDDAGTIRAITELLGDESKLREFGGKARDYTAKNFSMKTIVNRYQKLFDNLLSDGGKSRK